MALLIATVNARRGTEEQGSVKEGFPILSAKGDTVTITEMHRYKQPSLRVTKEEEGSLLEGTAEADIITMSDNDRYNRPIFPNDAPASFRDARREGRVTRHTTYQQFFLVKFLFRPRIVSRGGF